MKSTITLATANIALNYNGTKQESLMGHLMVVWFQRLIVACKTTKKRQDGTVGANVSARKK